MMGPPINFGSRGTSEVIDGPKFRVGVLREASSANNDKGFFSTSGLVLDVGCCSEPGSLEILLVEEGGEGKVVTYAVVETIARLAGAKVTEVLGLRFKMLGVAGLSRPLAAIAAAAAAEPAGTKWINLVAVGLASVW